MDDLTPEERELLKEQGSSLEELRARHKDCPQLAVLLAAQAGVLPEEALLRVTAHLEKCDFCQLLSRDLSSKELSLATAEEAGRVRKRVLTGAKAETKKAGLLAGWFWKALPVGALAVAGIALFLWIRLHPTSSPASSPVAVIQPATTTDPARLLSWEKLPIQLQAQSILVWRGSPQNAQEKYAAELTSALGFYRDDKFAEAVEQLRKVVKDFPPGVEGQLYLGISQLKLEQNAEAVGPLQAAQQLGPEQYRDDATWYLALAYLRTGDLQRGRMELQRLCGGTSGYAARACIADKTLAALRETPRPN